MKTKIYTIPHVWHIGNLDRPQNKNNQQGGSQEGCLLSCASTLEISEGWEEIARLGGFQKYLIKKENSEFKLLNYYRLTKKEISELSKLGHQNQLITGPIEKFKVSWTTNDEDGEQRRYTICDTKKETLEWGTEDEDRKINKVKSWKATEKLINYWQSRNPQDKTIDNLSINVALISYIFEFLKPELNLDGIFWNETFNPDALSAPRIGLFQTKITSLKIKKKELVTDEEWEQIEEIED
jgi:hypothetical protein